METPKKGSNAVSKLRAFFTEVKEPLTLSQINKKITSLEPNEISMALCYLIRQRYATRELVENPTPKSREKVWLYTYSETKLPKE